MANRRSIAQKSRQNPKKSDADLRRIAIGHAVDISCASGGHDAENSVKMAETFLAFLKGEEPKAA